MRPDFLRGFWKLSWVETKIFAREPMGFFATLIMPVVLFVILGRSFGATKSPSTADAGVTFNAAVLAAVVIAINAVQSLVAIISI
jgi:hypothetical protein